MLDFGWAELFLIMAVAVLVIGPSEIPGLMRGIGHLFRRVQYIKHAFTSQFDSFLEAADIEDLQKAVNFEAKPQGYEAFDEAAEDEDVMVPIEDAPKQEAEND